MDAKSYKKHLIKIYLSYLLGLLWFGMIYIYSRIFPETYQQRTFAGEISIYIILILGAAYIIFLIYFLSNKKSRECMRYYYSKKKKKNK